MKKPFLHISCALFASIFLLLNACSTKDDEPGVAWTDADKQSHDQVLSVQDQIGENLDDWFQSMDSLDAIQEAYEAFLNSENVSTATINSQGIAVQYSNGMRGGLFLRPKDDKGEVGESLFNLSPPETDEGLKSLVNKKKMILINPHYFERSYYTDQIINITSGKLGKVGMDLSTIYKNQEATVDRFTELSGYGIIQIYSHGWAWPKETNITDIYLLTGETANEATSAKYWDELRNGNIPVMKVAGPNKYLVSPRFISEHNDFSNDTILFFGGFCYSFLGDWPDIIDGFADGAYLGYDWSVYTFRNANWSVNSIAKMSDTSLTSPMTLEGWMQDPDVEKSYWNEKDSRTVHIHYAGDGNLKLWEDEGVSLIALSPDGKPVTQAGEAGVGYPFKCKVISSATSLEYSWDVGDGSSPVTTQGSQVEITWSENGNYLLQVAAINKTNGTVIGEASLNVIIGESETGIVEFMKTCDWVTVSLGKGSTLEYYPYSDINWVIENMSWSGLNFSGTTPTNYGGKNSINGTLSGDGQKITFTVYKESTDISYERDIKVTMTVTDYPLHTFVPPDVFSGYAHYRVDPPGDVSYVTAFEAEITQGGNTTYLSLADFDWTKINYLKTEFHPNQNARSSVRMINE
ncbi:MAG TPA: PKD domain-containing protein [Bacteroidales bacterium]